MEILNGIFALFLVKPPFRFNENNKIHFYSTLFLNKKLPTMPVIQGLLFDLQMYDLW